MPLPLAPALTPVPLPHSRTQTYTGYAYTPAPSPSPSSLEAWRNKPHRIQAWSRDVPTLGIGGGGMIWGKGVGVGSAEWSGTTHRSKDKRTEDEEDRGTEPTTYRKGGVDKGDRAGEVVKEQRKMGSQASSVGRHQRQLGSGTGSQANLGVPEQHLLSAPVRARPEISRSTSQIRLTVPSDTRAPPIPVVALPQHTLPAMSPALVPATQGQRPKPKPLGSEASAGSARSIREAYIESALQLPIEILSAKGPNPIPEAKASDRVKKSKSNLSTRADPEAKKSVDDTGRNAKSVGNAAARAGAEDVGKAVNKVGRSQTSAAALGSAKSGNSKRREDTVPNSKPKAGIPLEPVKTWPRSTARNDQARSRPDTVETLPYNLYLDLPTPPARHASLAPPTPSQQSQQQPHTSIPSSSVVTAAARSPTRVPKTEPMPGFHPSRRPTPAHRDPTPMLRPALSRSASSSDMLVKRREGDVPDLQARFEPKMYPLPASGTTTELELSQVRPDPRRTDAGSLGSATSHKSRMPIMIDLYPSMTPGSSYDISHPPLNHPPQISPPHLDFISPSSGNSPLAEGDRIAFEIPSGTRGRLRVSLAWFRDVKSPSKRWKDRIHVRGSKRASVGEDYQPPPLPIKDGKWSYSGNRSRDQGFRSSSPTHAGDRYRPTIPQRDRHRPSPPPSPRFPHRYSPLPRRIERERDRVRFSPEPPPNMARSPLAWAEIPNPYLTVPGIPGLPGSFAPPHPYRPNALRPSAPFQAYPQPYPNAWAAMSLPNRHAPSAPPTQAPPSPRPSIDPPSDISPPRINQPLPEVYRNRPLNYPAPMSMAYPQPAMTGPYGYRGTNTNGQNGYKGRNDLPWSGRPTIWQRMFSPSDRNGEAHWDQPRDGKEGLIRNWRRNIQAGKGTTVFGTGYRQDGARPPEQGYSSRREGRRWFSLPGLGQRSRRHDQDTYITAKTGVNWPISTNRQKRPYPAHNLAAPTAYNQPSRIPLPVRDSKERAKEERRAQRKYRRDKRDPGLQPPDARTIHPDDSVTRAAGAIGRPGLNERGRSGTMVKDWVERVSRPARAMGSGKGVPRENRKDGTSWKKRLVLRQQGPEVSIGGKLRQSNSRKQAKDGEGKFMVPFSLSKNRGMR